MALVRFLPAARRDFDESLDWYSTRSVTAALRFAAAVDAAVARIVTNRRSLSFIDQRHQQCPVKKFPFRVIFRSLHDEILVVALAHAKRRPTYWLNRE